MYEKILNPSNSISSQLEKIKQAFIDYYTGYDKKYKQIIEERFSKFTIVGYNTADQIENILRDIATEKETQLQEKFLHNLGLEPNKKNKRVFFEFGDSFRSENTAVGRAINILKKPKEKRSDFENKTIREFISKLEQVFETKDTEYIKLLILNLEVFYKSLLSEYKNHMQQFDSYNNYVEKCRMIESKNGTHDVTVEPEYEENRKLIDSLDLVNLDDGYGSELINNGITCVCQNLQRTGDSTNLYNLIFITTKSAPINYLDARLVHEINHSLESTLLSFDNSQYVTTCGWDILINKVADNNEETPVSKERDFEIFNEVINEIIAQEITESMHDNGVFIFSDKDNSKIRFGTQYEICRFIVDDFLEEFKPQIIESRLTGDSTILFEKIGKENFLAMNDLVRKFYKEFPGMKFQNTINQMKNNQNNEWTERINYYRAESAKIFEDMVTFSRKKAIWFLSSSLWLLKYCMLELFLDNVEDKYGT